MQLRLSIREFSIFNQRDYVMVRNGTVLDPLLQGGGQERDRRSGTHNVAGIVAMTEALRLTDMERVAENLRLAKLRDRLVDCLTSRLDDIIETEESAHRDRHEHGGASARPNDDELQYRTEEERVELGLDDYDPDSVPPAGPAKDFFAGKNVLSIVISIDKKMLNAGGPIMSAWASTNVGG